MNMSSQFWQGKTVLITGHTGFMGSWLSLWLHRMGATVHGYALPATTEPSLFHLARINTCVKTTTGDIRDLQQLTRTLEDIQPEIVFHLAAQDSVRTAYTQPVETMTTNIIGAINILEAARHTNSLRALVMASSDRCYANRDWLWGYREDDPMGGNDPYSSSKGAAELVTAAYRKSYFQASADSDVAIASVRSGNVIGGGDFAQDKLIPDFIRAIERESAVMLRNPHATQPWQFVLEPLAGYLQLARRLYEEGHPYAEGWNFGPADADIQTVSQVCALFNHFLHRNGIPAVPVERLSVSGQDTGFLRLDISKARQRLDWNPMLDLHSALDMTAQWYAGYINNENVREMCEDQIDFFMHLE